MKTKLFLTAFWAITTTGYAQSEKELANIEQLCGCYSVNFKYAETFSPDNAYKFHDREEMNATELALAVEKSKDKIVIQHLLVIQDTMVIKHWREEWKYQPSSMYEFKGDRIWIKKPLTAENTKGKWMQTVWEVSDEPRYQGLSAWIDNNNTTYWESTADAPLPRREYTVRNDYNVMRRHNKIQLTAEGYVHEQDNDKILRTTTGDKLIAQEKGYNTYYKMDDKECAKATQWWKENEQFWVAVRKEWEKLLQEKPTLALKPKVEEKVLNDHLNALWREWRKEKKTDFTSQIRTTLSSFVEKS